ncbi:unnamed protein product [Sympodiomycopsis kandeliae]
MSLAQRSPQRQFAIQDLSLQCASLKSASNAPRGVYLLPDESDPLVLHGVIFPPSKGPYSGGVFKFVIHWPGCVQSKQVSIPNVIFHQGLHHPLIHPSTRVLSLTPRFPNWRPRQDTLTHLLCYIRDCFGWKLIEDLKLREGWWTNAEMGRLLRTSTKMFTNLASQSAQLSNSASTLYAAHSDTTERQHTATEKQSRDDTTSGIQFVKMSQDEMDSLRKEIFGGDSSGPP